MNESQEKPKLHTIIVKANTRLLFDPDLALLSFVIILLFIKVFLRKMQKRIPLIKIIESAGPLESNLSYKKFIKILINFS